MSANFNKIKEIALSGRPMTTEEQELYYTLTDTEMDAISEIYLHSVSTNDEKAIANEFERIFRKLEQENPKAAENIAEWSKFTTVDELMQHFHDSSVYNLNEIMVLILQDKSVPEKVRDAVVEKLYEKNMGLVHAIISKYSRVDDGKMSNEELEQIGRVSIYKAIDRYDVSKGNRFSTLATTVIHNDIAGLFQNKVNKQRMNESSLNDLVENSKDGSGEAREKIDFIADPSMTPAEKLAKEAEIEQLYLVLDKLPPEQKFVAYARFGLAGVERKTQNEIAEYMHMSQANVSKIENAMLAKLKVLLLNTGMY